ncbi:putative methyltransferase [Candidatus Moduliflexus flocculans]|uniref:Putative methyltransferase n=1 Tax=Candidatus Moduliflexus flocculans TaxID=1499966 RepID=A0A081BM46_9BACT|nr:putative methyltransferase [Candidatus Moduliflexus flocculans]
MAFYEELAAEYDKMTRFDERLPKERAMLQGWRERYRVQSVLDAACGTGLHAVLLAQMGIRTVGTDLSSAMLAQAKGHADQLGVHVEWVQASMENVATHVHQSFDAVFCFGNSLPHLLTPQAFEAAASSFAQILHPAGILAIQLLNYTRVLSEKERVVGIHRHDNTEYVRFYDFLDPLIRFNVLTIQWQGDHAASTLNATTLYPYQQDEIETILAQHGFGEFECFGDMQFHPFIPEQSPNVVIVANKKA